MNNERYTQNNLYDIVNRLEITPDANVLEEILNSEPSSNDASSTAVAEAEKSGKEYEGKEGGEKIGSEEKSSGKNKKLPWTDDFSKAITYRNEKNLEKAIEHITQAYNKAEFPSYIMIRGMRAMMYEEHGDYKKAVDDLTELMGPFPDHVHLHARARNYEKLGEYRKAIDDLHSALGTGDKFTDKAKLYTQLAGIYQKTGDAELADKYSEMAKKESMR